MRSDKVFSSTLPFYDSNTFHSWEYPNIQGLGCNTISPNDTANFLAFLKEIRADEFGSTLLLSAATAISPFADENGTPSTDVSGFAEVLDWIAIMNYDLWVCSSCSCSKVRQSNALLYHRVAGVQRSDLMLH